MPDNHMISVLHIRSSSGFYGAESVIMNLLRELPKNRIKVQLAVFENYLNSNRELYEKAKAEDIKTLELKCRGKLDIQTLKHLCNFIRSNNIDCIHTHDYKSHFYGSIAAKLTKRRLVSTLHGWISNTISLKFYNLLEKLILLQYDAIITVSEEMKNKLGNEVPRIKNVVNIANGVNTDLYFPGSETSIRKELGIAESDFVFAIVARLSQEKGHPFLLEAFSRIVVQHPSAKLLIVGDGPDRAALQNLSDSLKINTNVFYTGARSDIPNILRNVDCYVSTSLTEGMPMIILEAMASGLPIISTSVGDIPMMLSENAGILIGKVNAERLHSEMINIIKMERNSILGERARKRCTELFSISNQANEYKSLYEDIVNKTTNMHST